MKAGIVGAGIMGRLLAFALYHAGWQVSIFEQQDENNCSMAAAGLLTPVAELAKAELIIFQMGMEAIQQHWPSILQQLPEEVTFQQTGSLVVAHPHDVAELQQFIHIITDKLKDQTQYQLLDAVAIKTIEPALEKFSKGYFFPKEGYLDNQALLSVLARYLENKIATLERERINDMKDSQKSAE